MDDDGAASGGPNAGDGSANDPDTDGHDPKPGGYVPPEDWATVVRSVPIASVDLVVRCDGGVVLGERRNDPGKGEWFVPGGRVHKGERLREAVQRVAREELGVSVTVEADLGVYEHLYDTSDVDSKHYVPTGYLVVPDGDPVVGDDQHADLAVFEPPFPDLHPYVEAYLDDAGEYVPEWDRPARR